MNLFGLSILLVSLPLLSQIILGTLSLLKNYRIKFSVLSLINFVLIIMFTYLGIQIISNDAKQQGVDCGMPNTAFIFFSFGIIILQSITIVLQLIYKKYKNKKKL